MTQALHSAIESINALSLKEKHQLLLILDEAIAQVEENDWIENDKTASEMQKVREEYKSGEYIAFSEYIAQKQL
ncbi:hypothetical protein APA_2695 [Pseudanabaena sp. lw0831]|uniref:hypothetical protein n=1 Tax=Pseudanabaena sp. lw0831 TaxID=1357935 RepID=UPI001916A9AA|nr:hypothetical protein [Pseudanabaena sp. lw0831]GBO51824.1 hypothetical protein APA_2695 [Pseudanabaena sp. lw0831]